MRYATKVEKEQLLTPQPLYGRVRQLLVEQIQKGDWMVGDSLPNEGDLAKKFGVSVGTVRKAIEGLESNGLIKRIQGRGTYVTGIGSHVLRQKFVRLRGEDGKDIRLAYDLLSISRVPPPTELSDIDEWRSETEFVKVVQLVRFGQAGTGYEISHLPTTRLPNFQKHMTFGQDLYPLLGDYGLIVTHAREQICLTNSTQDIADVLGAQPGEPILQISRVGYCIDKSPIEHRISQYRARGVIYDIEIG